MKSFQRLILIFSIFSLFALSACGVQQKESKLEFKPHVIKEGEGTYLGIIDRSHIRVHTDGVNKMVEVPKNLMQVIKKMDENDTFSFEYEVNEEGAYIIKSVTGTTKTIRESSNDNKKQKEEESKDDESMNGSQGFTMDPNKDFSLKQEGGSDALVSNGSSNYKAVIDMISETTDITKERWGAAAILKQNGELKELKNDKIPDSRFIDSKFVFYSSSDSLDEYILVKEFDEHLFRITITIPSSDKDNHEIWDVLSTIKVN
jgi:hypothetical protein